jgi:hypothetical protein
MLGKRIVRGKKWNIKLGRSKRTKIFNQEEDFFLHFQHDPAFLWLHEINFPSTPALLRFFYKLELFEAR